VGDRYDRDMIIRRRRSGGMRVPELILSWGLTHPEPAPKIGHNNGPPIDEPGPDAFVRYRWRKAHAEAWKNPSMGILKFRVARAKAAGVSYREYVSELLDTGRHLQAADVAARRKGETDSRT
jgi:hypothetical protein